MGSLIGWLIAKGVSQRFARPLAFLLLAIAAAAAMGGAKCAYDAAVISRHEAKQEAATAKADRKADGKAAAQRQDDDRRLTQEEQQLEEVQKHAPTDLDRRLAFHRCLRLQQSARAEGREPPACA
jgi:hypothetical protein